MSDIIKLNMKSKKMNVSLRNQYSSGQIKQENSEDLLQLQFAQHYERGFDDGRKTALEESEKAYNQKLERKYAELNNIISVLEARAAEYSQTFENLVIQLSVAIAEKILEREISKDSIIENILTEALKRVIGANKVLVKLNPDDLKNFNIENKNFFSEGSLSKINFESDERIDKGGCLVETEIGNVDARISTQLNELKKQFEANLSSENI